MDAIVASCRFQAGGRCIGDYSVAGLAEEWDVENLG